MNTIIGIIKNLSPNKYISKNDKIELEKLCQNLDKIKYEKLVEGLNDVIKATKYTKKLKETIDNLTHDLQQEDITQEQINDLIEEAINEIQDDNLELSLDYECDRYNKFTESNPVEHIYYNKAKSKYILDYKGKTKTNKNLSKLVTMLKIIYFKDDKIILPKKYKIYENKLISYEYNNKELFDINHIINILNHKCKVSKYKQIKKYIKYNSVKNNNIGGFYIKEYIERDDIKYIIMNNRTTGLIKLLELIKEPIIYKLPIEIEISKNLYEIFYDYEPELNYSIGKYYVDLY